LSLAIIVLFGLFHGLNNDTTTWQVMRLQRRPAGLSASPVRLAPKADVRKIRPRLMGR
jgi:hypothetical protein